MKMILQREASTDVYTAPQCRVYTVSLENVIAQSNIGDIDDEEYDDGDGTDY